MDDLMMTPRHYFGRYVVVLTLLLAGTTAAQNRTMGLMYHDSTRSYQGYTLLAPMPYDVVYLIDNEGRQVHSWGAPPSPDLSVYLLEDGNLLRTAHYSPARSKVEILDWDGNLKWGFDYHADSVHQHHDIEMLPNGNIVMVAWETRTTQEAVEAGRNPSTIYDGLKPEHLIEVDTSTGAIVWEWHAWDHLVQDFDSTKQNFGVVRDHPELIDINYNRRNHPDIMHVNAVDYNAEFDQLIISPRAYSEVWVIDHSTTTEEARGHIGGRYGRGGDLLYRWGNPETYDRGDTLRHRLYYQHDAQWVPDSVSGAGRLLVYSNGSNNRAVRQWSSVEEWQPPIDSLGCYYLGPDSTYGPEEPTWWYRDTVEFYSDFISGCQRLPNGNTLICEGGWGTLFEVTPDSEVVWQYISPVCSSGPMHQGVPMSYRLNSVFRCYRYSPDYPAFEGRNLTPGGPIELPPAGLLTGGENVVPRVTGPTVVPSAARHQVSFGFSLSDEGRVELAVFDSQGRLVDEVLDGTRPAGRHRVLWRAGGLPAGTYFCHFSTEASSATRRFTVVR